MTLSIEHQGRTLRADQLTVEQLDQARGTVGIVAKLVEAAGGDPNITRLADLKIADFPDDLPDTYTDGLPASGGRPMDSYVVAFAKPPWCWPPSVTRKQTLRDLNLIFGALA